MLLADCHLFQSSGDLFPVVFEIQHDDILTEIDVIEICLLYTSDAADEL